MIKRPGFTLIELLIAVLIFGYMSLSMATIYSTANRHMFQNYRNNMIKSNVALAMRDIRRNLSQATRIDLPLYNNPTGSELKFAINVDQTTGCYPINQYAPVTWHYFCTAPDPGDPTFTDLFHYTGTVATDTTWCGSAPDKFWDPLTQYAVPACGAGGGTIIMQYSVPADAPNSSVMFSRRPAAPDNVYEADSVLVTLRSRWVATARFGGVAKASQRDVDFTLSSKVKLLTPPAP